MNNGPNRHLLVSKRKLTTNQGTRTMIDADLLKQARKYVFDYFYENTYGPVLEEAMREFHLDREKAGLLFNEMEASHYILLVPGTQRILMANPFSAVATPFVDAIDGKRYFANCAWDTVSLHVMVHRDADVSAFCHHCAEPIRMRLSRGKRVSGRPENPLIFLSVPVAKWYDNLINTCSNNMVYFSSEQHQLEWLDSHPSLHGETLTVEKMAEACKPLSQTRMDLDYTRPTACELTAYWNSIGLDGDYWKI